MANFSCGCDGWRFEMLWRFVVSILGWRSRLTNILVKGGLKPPTSCNSDYFVSARGFWSNFIDLFVSTSDSSRHSLVGSPKAGVSVGVTKSFQFQRAIASSGCRTVCLDMLRQKKMSDFACLHSVGTAWSQAWLGGEPGWFRYLREVGICHVKMFNAHLSDCASTAIACRPMQLCVSSEDGPASPRNLAYNGGVSDTARVAVEATLTWLAAVIRESPSQEVNFPYAMLQSSNHFILCFQHLSKFQRFNMINTPKPFSHLTIISWMAYRCFSVPATCMISVKRRGLDQVAGGIGRTWRAPSIYVASAPLLI